MQVSESRILHSVNAKNNSLYYNESNGIKWDFDGPPDVEHMQALVDKIQNKIGLSVTIEPIGDIVVLKKLQVRYEEDENHKREIKERIEDAGGDTSSCFPVVVYEARGANGEDIIGDGNHTVQAAKAAKHCTSIPVIRVPKEIHKTYTDAELKGVGNLLNKKPEIVKKPLTIDDAVKQIEETVKSGATLEQFSKDEHTHRHYLQVCGFTNKQITRIINKVKNSIQYQQFLTANKLWINYTKDVHKQILDSTVEGFKTTDTMAICVSSAMFKWDKLLNTLFAHTEETKKGRIKKKDNMVVVVYHTSPNDEREWKMDIQPQIYNKIEFFFKPLGYNIRIHEMPTTMTNNPFLNHE